MKCRAHGDEGAEKAEHDDNQEIVMMESDENEDTRNEGQ